MKEYIERDKLYDTESLLMSDVVKQNPVANYILEQVLFDIKETPAADVKEVIHAHIVETVENGRFKRFCSNCNSNITTLTQWAMPNYCIKCGAKMDLE